MDVKLRVITGTHAGKELKIACPQFVIGRDQDCQLRAGSDSISRRHCQLSMADGRLTVQDLGSSNGTAVNGVTIEAETELHSGDHLEVGPLSFEVLIDHRVGGPKRPAVKGLTDVAARTAAPPQSKCAEDDISRWLGDPEPKTTGTWKTGGKAIVPDNQSVTDAQSVQLGSSDTLKASTSDTVKTKLPLPDDKAQNKKGYGKLPKLDAPAAKDSCEAAANILKKLSKRR